MTNFDIDFILYELKESGYDVTYEKVKKDGVLREALIFKGESNVSPVVYLHNFTELSDERAVVNRIIDIVENSHNKLSDDFDVASWDIMKNYVESCVANIDNVDSDVIVERISSDIVKYVRIVIPADKFDNARDIATIVVKKQLLDNWNITTQELFSHADKNIQKNMVIKDFYGMLNFATNTKNIYGAIYGFTVDGLNAISERMRVEEFYVIPSSIHEVIIFTDLDNEPEYLKTLVGEVNGSVLAVNERLSDSVYKYSAKTQYLEEM